MGILGDFGRQFMGNGGMGGNPISGLMQFLMQRQQQGQPQQEGAPMPYTGALSGVQQPQAPMPMQASMPPQRPQNPQFPMAGAAPPPMPMGFSNPAYSNENVMRALQRVRPMLTQGRARRFRDDYNNYMLKKIY